MSSASVLEAQTSPTSHIGQGKDNTFQQRVPTPAGPTRRPTQSHSAVNDTWANQLVPLASQYHMSDYSRIKYGHEGCPVTYMPLSLHVPDVVRKLRERQEKYVDQVLWLPAESALVSKDPSLVIPASEQRAALFTGENTTPHVELQQELCNAISESIPNRSQSQSQLQVPPLEQQSNRHRSSQVKTSDTHPINISVIIPPESLVAISSHLTPCSKPSPVLFDIPLSYSLDRIIGYAQLLPSLANSPIIPLRSTSVPHLLPPLPLRKCHASSAPHSLVSDALHAALNTRIPLPPLPIPSPRALSLKPDSKIQVHTVSGEEDESNVNTTNIIPKLLTPRRSMYAPTQALSHHPESRFPSVYDLLHSATFPRPPSHHVHPPTAPSPPRGIVKHRTSTASHKSLPSSQSTVNHRSFRLGNLLLSSCPGKKVRLSGPVRGRGTVYRDLDVDLRRMKSLGARCVVCCLDNEELQFLGVSWIEYCRAAHGEGLDVLRIPLPEGLAPLSPKSLDADLDRIIERYTLLGISVLVHCRGGVGRAGLFACCWMLKLGLCGWIETDVSPSPAGTSIETEVRGNDTPQKSFQWDSNMVVRRDTLQLVERVIGVVRRRRSAKAIETLEQVQFLVEYVDYLRACGCAGEVLESVRKSDTSS